jgi:hypothetical protein
MLYFFTIGRQFATIGRSFVHDFRNFVEICPTAQWLLLSCPDRKSGVARKRQMRVGLTARCRRLSFHKL